MPNVPHPGKILRQQFMEPRRLSGYAVSKKIGVPRTRVERLSREKTPVTPDTALRLGAYFGTAPRFWMDLQAEYDLAHVGRRIERALMKIEPLQEARDAAFS